MVFTLQPGIYEVSSVKQITKGCIPKSKHLFYVKLTLVVIAYVSQPPHVRAPAVDLRMQPAFRVRSTGCIIVNTITAHFLRYLKFIPHLAANPK